MVFGLYLCYSVTVVLCTSSDLETKIVDCIRARGLHEYDRAQAMGVVVSPESVSDKKRADTPVSISNSRIAGPEIKPKSRLQIMLSLSN